MAAALRDVEAFWSLAVAYEKGEGVPRDAPSAFGWCSASRLAARGKIARVRAHASVDVHTDVQMRVCRCTQTCRARMGTRTKLLAGT
jgi:hypothetical protein